MPRRHASLRPRVCVRVCVRRVCVRVCARACASLCASLALSLLLAATLLPAAALAQSAPPSVVGWLAQSSGAVWVTPASGQPWQAALPNQPVSPGEAVATAPNGQATIEVMAMRAALGPGSVLALDQLGAQGLTATETSGEVALDLSALPPATSVAVATPRGTVEIASPGFYEIAAGDANSPTIVTALDGSARIVNASAVEQVGPDQTATLEGGAGGAIDVAIMPAEPDALLQSLRASAAPPPAVAPPPAIAEMTGGAALAAYGAWSTAPDYGTVWYPNVAAGWAPYRYGQWTYVAPWGWTWCDSDPWGFAPFHYGRWVQVGPRWGWIPVAQGVSVSAGYPVYAPALVHFFGAGPNVGWVPLGPGEIYRPPYATSPAYLRAVNAYNVRNINHVNFTRVANNQLTINNFVNRRAATYVPGSVLADGRPVAPAFAHAPHADLAAFRPLPAGVPIRPAARPVPAAFHGAAAPPPFHRPAAPQPAAFRRVSAPPTAHPIAAPRAPEAVHPVHPAPAAATMQPHPAPEPHPAPHPTPAAVHPETQPRPAPRPETRPAAPPPHPEARPAPHPAEPPHPAPEAAHRPPEPPRPAPEQTARHAPPPSHPPEHPPAHPPERPEQRPG